MAAPATQPTSGTEWPSSRTGWGAPLASFGATAAGRTVLATTASHVEYQTIAEVLFSTICRATDNTETAICDSRPERMASSAASLTNASDISPVASIAHPNVGAFPNPDVQACLVTHTKAEACHAWQNHMDEAQSLVRPRSF